MKTETVKKSGFEKRVEAFIQKYKLTEKGQQLLEGVTE